MGVRAYGDSGLTPRLRWKAEEHEVKVRQASPGELEQLENEISQKRALENSKPHEGKE